MALSTRRDRAIAIAPHLFAGRGYAATSMREVAEAAGYSKATLHRHFTTKDELVEAFAEDFVLDVDAILSSVSLDADADEDRVTVIKAYLLALISQREVAKVVLCDAGVRRSPIGQRVDDQQRGLAARLAGPRASLRQQVRARCALAIVHLLVDELATVPAHRLRQPLLEAAIDTLVLRSEDPATPANAARWYKGLPPVSVR